MRPAAKGGAVVLAACLLSSGAEAAGDRRDMQISLPQATAEHTVANLGFLVLKLQTNSIALGLADGPIGTAIPSFASARSAGVFSVTGMARASLSLTLDLGDPLTGLQTKIPLPLRGIASAAQASLMLDRGGRVTVNIGSSFGFSGPSRGVPMVGGTLSLSTDVLKPWKRAVLRYRAQF